MNYILFDDHITKEFYPLTLTRPCADLFMGCMSNRSRWEHSLSTTTSSLELSYLAKAFPLIIGADNVLINGRVVPSPELIKEIGKLEAGQALIKDDTVVAVRLNEVELKELMKDIESYSKTDAHNALYRTEFQKVRSEFKLTIIEHLWDLFENNGSFIEQDIEAMDLSAFDGKAAHSTLINENQIFIHKDAKVSASILSAENGPIIIDEGAEVMEGSVVRGPFYLGKNAALKMGSKIYGPTSIGTYSKVGGEVNNSIVSPYSNKAHDGFLGNSVIGQWCNLGADTNTSNLKNDYGSVAVWNYPEATFVDSGRQFVGLMMGDHSKCGINTMFNTGSVIGVSCNIFGGDFIRKFVPSFSWGGRSGIAEYKLDKALGVAENVMGRRNIQMSDGERSVLQHLSEEMAASRQK